MNHAKNQMVIIMDKNNSLGDSLLNELSCLVEEVNISLENGLKISPKPASFSVWKKPTDENTGEKIIEQNSMSPDEDTSFGHTERIHISELVENLRNTIPTEEPLDFVQMNTAWLTDSKQKPISGHLKKLRITSLCVSPSPKPFPSAVSEAFYGTAINLEELDHEEKDLLEKLLSEEEIYGETPAVWRKWEEEAERNADEAEMKAKEAARKVEAAARKTETEKKTAEEEKKSVEEIPPEKTPIISVETKTVSDKKHPKWNYRAAGTGVTVGLCLIFGYIGLGMMFQNHFVSALKKSIPGKMLYSEVETSLAKSTVTLRDAEFTLPEKDTPAAGANVRVDRAVFRLDPYSLVTGRVVVKDAQLEGMHFVSPPDGKTMKNHTPDDRWALTPLLNGSAEDEIRRRMNDLSSVSSFQEMKQRYLPQYADLAQRSQRIHENLKEIQENLKSRFGLNALTGVLPSLEKVRMMVLKENPSAAAQLSARENSGNRDTAQNPESHFIKLVSHEEPVTLPKTSPVESVGFALFRDERGNRITGDEWVQKEGNAEFLVHEISRLMQLRRESETIYEDCDRLRREVEQDMAKVTEKISEDGDVLRPYLDVPVLEEDRLADALFAGLASENIRELAAWTETLQQMCAAEIKMEHSTLHGNVTLFGREYRFSADWQRTPENSAKKAAAAGNGAPIFAGEILLTPVWESAAGSEIPSDTSGKIKIKLVKNRDVLTKHIEMRLTADETSAQLWGAGALPLEASHEFSLMTVDITQTGDRLAGKMEMTYRHPVFQSVTGTPGILPAGVWETKINALEMEKIGVRVTVSGTANTPAVMCHSAQMESLLPAYSVALNEIHREKQQLVSEELRQKLLDAEDSFHGAIQPFYNQIVSGTENIDRLHLGLQSFLVQNMKREPVLPRTLPPHALPARETFLSAKDILAGHYPKENAGDSSSRADYLAAEQSAGGTSTPDGTENHLADINHPRYEVVEESALDIPVFRAEWSEISPAVGGNATEVLETENRKNNYPPMVFPNTGKAVTVPVRRMSAAEKEKIGKGDSAGGKQKVIHIPPLPSQEYSPEYLSPPSPQNPVPQEKTSGPQDIFSMETLPVINVPVDDLNHSVLMSAEGHMQRPQAMNTVSSPGGYSAAPQEVDTEGLMKATLYSTRNSGTVPVAATVNPHLSGSPVMHAALPMNAGGNNSGKKSQVPVPVKQSTMQYGK